jgi:hypothetical protein
MVLVVLEYTDEPEHTTWDCPKCHNPIVEIVNGHYKTVTEVFDPTNNSVMAVGRKCHGRLRNGGHCKYWYYFSLNVPQAIV